MILLAFAAVVLLAGAVVALALKDNDHRAWAGIASQSVATALVWGVVLPILRTGADERAVFRWAYPTDTINVHVDALSAFFLAWSLPMTVLGSVYAAGYLRPYFHTRNAGVQFALLNVTALSFVMVYSLETATAFLLGWEIAAVAAWLLVIWEYRNQKIRFAGFNYLVSTHLGFFVLVAAFMLMYGQTGSLDFGAFGRFLHTPSPLRSITFVLLVISFGLKSAFFPFHTWLPRAHSAAPAHVSALMSGVIHKAGLYGLLRFTLLMGEPEEWMGWTLIGFSALSAFIGVLYTTSQRDLKRLLGYSSTENVGIAGLGFGLGYLGLTWHRPALVVLGFTAGILHVLNHALFKCLLFYAAGAIYRATHVVDLEKLGGLVRQMPKTAFLFLLGGLAIAGLPPLNGFVSEFLLYAGLLASDGPPGIAHALLIATAALLALVGGVSALAMTRAYGVAFLGSPRDASVHCEGEVSALMLIPMAVHAVGVIALGVFPVLGLAAVRQSVALFTTLLTQPPSAPEAATPEHFLAPVTTISLLMAGVFAALWGARRVVSPSPLPATEATGTWGCGYVGGTPRMQYTASSFSAQFTNVYRSVLEQLRREKLPEGVFPEKNGFLNTHFVDAVERRIFEGLGEAEAMVSRVAAGIPQEPRVAFGAGLVVIIALLAWLIEGLP
jgi:hydrogenase-4 component B